MKVLSVHEGHSLQEAIDTIGFELLLAERVEATPSPTEGELQILRSEVDPARIILGR